MRKTLFWVIAVVGVGGASPAQDSRDPWRIHEWGTFTSLQNESGRTIGWINTEDEPVPDFVHRLRKSLLVPIDDLPPVLSKGAPHLHPDVLVRLETPVLYFHPPKGASLPARIDLKVDFRGGWLTEFYPDGRVTAPGLDVETADFGRLGPGTVGSLEWKGLWVGKEGEFPATRDAVWLAPRDVRSAPVMTADQKECEGFIFYRGVAYLEAPLAAVRSREGNRLSIFGRLPRELAGAAPLRIPQMWLVDIREGGDIGFRTLPGAELTANPDRTLANVESTFLDREYSPGNLSRLRREMKEGLMAEGLYADEADALLNTWEASYFHAPGLRLFFMVPRAWTDHVLPLKASIPAEVSRAMIGRLELVTPAQRACLKRIINAKEVSNAWYFEWQKNHPEAVRRFLERRREGDLQSLRKDCVQIPDNYVAYLQLGRFRNSLVLDAYKRGAVSLRSFIETYDLAPASVSER
ncbi:MAG TPA: hypothetical protein VEN81_07845 [Planctomycetota bacterium]|nr:hypothetical protein [Planctomycetota bacterium]